MRGSHTDGKLTFVVKNKGFDKSFKNRNLSVKVGDRIIETMIDVKNRKPPIALSPRCAWTQYNKGDGAL